MATIKSVEIDTNELNCPICLEIYDIPVSISCGHTFCKACIKMSVRKNGKSCPTCQYDTFHIPEKRNVIIQGLILKLYPERAKLEQIKSDIIHVIVSSEYKKHMRILMDIIKSKVDVEGISNVSKLVDPLMNHIIMGSSGGHNMKNYKTFIMENNIYIYKIKRDSSESSVVAQLIRKNTNIFKDAESVVKVYSESRNAMECANMNLRSVINGLIKHMPDLHNIYIKLHERMKQEKTLNKVTPIDLAGMLDDSSADDESQEELEHSIDSNEAESTVESD